MTKNPLINALSASTYIGLVVSIMNLIIKTQGTKPDSVFAPIIFLSLLTLSVAVMGYLFFYQPLQIFIEGKKKEAVNLFIQTVGAFAMITLLISIILFSGVL